MDKNSLCRLCLRFSEEFHIIFDESTGEGMPVVGPLLQMFQLNISPDSTKSNVLCIKCFSRLEDFKQFYDQCVESENKWEKFKEENEEPVEYLEEEKEEPVEYLDEYKEEMIVSDLVKIEQPIRKPKKKPKKKPTVVLRDEFKEFHDKMEDEEKIRKFYDLQCYECNPAVRSNSFNAYKSHLKVVHATTHPGVLCCGKKLSKRMDLFDHMDFHLNPNRLKCPHCQRVYSDRKNLKAHVIRQHGTDEQRPFKCDHCGKRFTQLELLRTHMRCHMSEETKRHMKNFVCTECDLSFLTEAVLKSHIKFTHKRQGFICVLCARHFKSKFFYQLHQRNEHEIEGPSREQCPHCRKWYSNSLALKCHIRSVHERTEPIVCKMCGFETTSKQGLNGHMRMKHRERAYGCEYCSKSFATAFRLKEHRTTHTGVTLYSCTYCQKEFNMKSNMYKHYKALHLAEWRRDKVDKNRDPALYKAQEFFR